MTCEAFDEAHVGPGDGRRRAGVRHQPEYEMRGVSFEPLLGKVAALLG